MVDRSVRVVLAGEASAFISSMRTATETVRVFAREGVNAKTPYEELARTLDRGSAAARRLATSADDIGGGFRNSIHDVDAFNDALRRTGENGGLKDVDAQTRMLRESLTNALAPIHDVAAALRGVVLPPGGLGGADHMIRQLRDLQDQVDKLRASAGKPIPMPVVGGGHAGSLTESSGGGGRGMMGGYLGYMVAGAAIGAVGGAIASTIKQTADFQMQLSVLGAITQTSGAQLDAAGRKALALGADITIANANASDAAVTMTQLGKNGFSLADAMTAAKGSMQLAAAGGVTFVQAANIQSAALHQFQMAPTMATSVANALVNAANVSKGNLKDIGDAMAYAGTNAHQLGWTLQDTLGVMALYARGGMGASMMGTTIKDLTGRLAANADKSNAAGDAMRTLGIHVYDANGHFLSASKLTDDLTEAHKRLSPAAYNAAVQVAFGMRAVVGANIMAQQGSKVLDSLTSSVRNNSGAVAFSAAKMNGLQGAFLNLQNQVETAQVSIGLTFAHALTNMTNGIAAAVPVITSFLTGGSFSGALHALGTWFDPLITGAKSVITVAWPYIQTFGRDLGLAWNGVIAGIKPVADALGNFFHQISQDGTVRSFGNALTTVGSGIAGVASYLKPVGDVIAGVVGWFARLPSPVKDAAIALGVMKLAIGPLSGIFASVRQEIVMATYGMGALGFAGRSVGTTMGMVGTSIKTAFGGWVGLGLTAAVTALTFFIGNTKDATAATTDFSGAIDTNTGKLAANATATIASQVKDAEAAYVAAGGAMGDYTAGVTGNTAAQQRVLGVLSQVEAKAISSSDTWRKYGTVFSNFGITAADVAGAVNTGGTALDVLKGRIASSTDMTKRAGLTVNDLNGIFQNLAKSTVGPAGQIATFKGNIGSLSGKIADSTSVAKNAAAAQKVLDQTTAAMKKPIDDAATAWANYVDWASQVPGIHVMANNKGVISFLSDTQMAFDKVKQAAADATTQADLFWFAMQDPTKVTNQQTIYADAAAIRAVGAAFRQQAADIADVTTKQAALAAVQNRATGKQADGTVYTGAQKIADEAQATRDLKAAQDTLANSDSANFDAQQAAGKLAAQRISQIYTETNARKGSAAAVAAVTGYLAQERQNFIASETASGVTLQVGVDITEQAQRDADALNLIPAKATQILESDATVKLKIYRDLKDAAVAAAAKRTVEFQTKVQDALVDVEAFGVNVAKIPTQYRTSFVADIKAASANGYSLYQVYNATTGKWQAEFTTPNIASAQTKAGDLVRQYDRARGTWNANLIATDSASAKVQALSALLAGIPDKTVKLQVMQVVANSDIAANNAAKQSANAAHPGSIGGNARGGLIHGPGTGTSDSILSWISNGEFINTAKSTAVPANRRAFEYANRGGVIPGFAEGGLVTRDAMDVSMSNIGNAGTTALNTVSKFETSVIAQVNAANARTQALMAAASATSFVGPQSASGLLGSQRPDQFGWVMGQNIVPFSFQGVQFPSGVAAGTPPIWSAFLSQLAPMIPGGINPGEDWGYENRDNVNSPGQKSFHAYGLALDVNSSENPNTPGTRGPAGSGKFQIPAGADALARRYNMLWGGEWGDAMHFELHETPQQVAGGTAVSSLASTVSAAAAGLAALAGAGSTAGLPSSVTRWQGLADHVFAAKGFPVSQDYIMLNQMSHESSGNPQAINLTDSNALAGHPSVGLLQFIPSTFAQYADPGFNSNIYDPESQMRAFLNYVPATYGSLAQFSQRNYGAYANGGYVSGAGGPRSDSIAARLSDGEFVVNADSTAANLELLTAINAERYAGGGLVHHPRGPITWAPPGAVGRRPIPHTSKPGHTTPYHDPNVHVTVTVRSSTGPGGSTVGEFAGNPVAEWTPGPALASVYASLTKLSTGIGTAAAAASSKVLVESSAAWALSDAKVKAAQNVAFERSKLTLAERAGSTAEATQAALAAAQLTKRAELGALAVRAAQSRLDRAGSAGSSGGGNGAAVAAAEMRLTRAEAESGRNRARAVESAQASLLAAERRGGGSRSNSGEAAARAALATAQARANIAMQALESRINILQTSKSNSVAAKIELAQLQLAKTQQLGELSVAHAQRTYDAAKKTADAYVLASQTAQRMEAEQRSLFQAQAARAAQVDSLTVTLNSERSRVASMQADRATMAGQFTSTAQGFDGGITGHADTRTTFARILAGQEYNAQKVRQFNADLGELRAKSLSTVTLQNLANAGVDGGGATADILAKASRKQIAQLNAVNAQTTMFATSIGNNVAGATYDAGISVGQGIVKGIESQIDAIQAVMTKVATSVIGTLTRALRIHSPSQVTHELGVHTVNGFINGVTSGMGGVNAVMSNMVQIPQVPTQQNWGGGGAQNIEVQVFLEGQRIDDRVDVRINHTMTQFSRVASRAAMQG